MPLPLVARAFVALLLATLLVATVAAASTIWRVGAASRTILPTVDGRTDYVVPLPPTDASSPGTFVKRFDVGQIAVGNGAAECHWVRDDLRARVATIGPDSNGKIAVFVSVEVYMLLYNDLQQYYDMVRVRIGEARYKNLIFVVHGQHNHEGPDTAGIGAVPVNHDYYDYMLQQMVDATADALNESKRVDAVLKFGSAVFYYGLGDIRDPRVQDARVRVLRAYPTSNNVTSSVPVFTMAQWGMHPETTLGYSPDVNPANCSALPLRPATGCARNAVFTHDYPGYFSAQLTQLYGGGEALYFNGAIGVQIGNHGPVWEVDSQHPLGNGGTVPTGAEIVPENFRRAYLIGTQLANFVYSSISDQPNPLTYGAFIYRVESIWVRVTNFNFRVGLVPANAINPRGDPSRPFRIGNTLRQAYTCQRGAEPSFDTCKPDNYAFLYDSVTRLPFRVGNYMQSETKYLNIGGNFKWITIPGELCPELATGLPQDFDTPIGTTKYFKQPNEHAVGKEYTIPGALMSMLQCDEANPCWVSGLTQDEVGYMFPISDWRLKCTAGENCTHLYQIGALNFTDSMAGSACKKIVDYPAAAKLDYTYQFGADVWNAINHTCFYGQMEGKAQGHYEETNAASWDVAEAFFQGVGKLLGKQPTGRYCQTSETCAGIVPSPASGTF